MALRVGEGRGGGASMYELTPVTISSDLRKCNNSSMDQTVEGPWRAAVQMEPNGRIESNLDESSIASLSAARAVLVWSSSRSGASPATASQSAREMIAHAAHGQCACAAPPPPARQHASASGMLDATACACSTRASTGPDGAAGTDPEGSSSWFLRSNMFADPGDTPFAVHAAASGWYAHLLRQWRVSPARWRQRRSCADLLVLPNAAPTHSERESPSRPLPRGNGKHGLRDGCQPRRRGHAFRYRSSGSA